MTNEMVRHRVGFGSAKVLVGAWAAQTPGYESGVAGASGSRERFVFAQLRGRERRAGRTGGLFFWRDRTREVDFVVDREGT